MLHQDLIEFQELLAFVLQDKRSISPVCISSSPVQFAAEEVGSCVALVVALALVVNIGDP